MKPSNRKDMTLRRKLRRGLALVLAVVLVAGLGLSYSPDRVLRAEEVTAETPAVEKTVHREASAHKEPEPAPAPEPEPAKEDAPAPADDGGGDTVELQIEAPAGNDGQAAQGGETSNAVNEEELVLDAEGAADEDQTDEETAEETLDDIYIVSKEHLELLATLLMAEAEGETELGKRLVIDTVLNRVDSRMFPNTIEDVVFQPMAFSSIWDERFYDCYVTAENFEIAKQETEGRTNEDVLYFRTGRYSIYGTSLFKEDHHYFSGQ